MSTYLHDVPTAAAVAAGLYPEVRTSSVDGPAVDTWTGDGPCFAVQLAGVVGAGTTLAGRIEQSADGSTGWAAISGATFTAVTTSSRIETIRFTPAQRYVRWSATISGGDPSVAVAAIIGRQKKTF